jgi:hypothetical protein
MLFFTQEGRFFRNSDDFQSCERVGSFFDRESKGVSIVGIQLVSPPFLNGSAHWKMEPLIRIWKKPSDPLAHVYEVADGKQYCSAYGTWDISEYEFWKEFTSLQ